MAPRKTASNWIPIVWAIGIAIVGWVFAGGIFYATTGSKLAHHDVAISELTKVLKEESIKRDQILKEEALKREEVRKDFLVAMKDQSTVFTGFNDKLSNINADVKVQNSRYESVIDRLNKLGEDVKQTVRQTTPTATGSVKGR